uniref:RNase H type-1 domain-containing protein n=1 Tax=Cannabis sativa TaxID=3483 RepID=A0A803QGR3_CANSA
MQAASRDEGKLGYRGYNSHKILEEALGSKKLPSKMKNLLWWARKKCLPTMVMLRTKRVECLMVAICWAIWNAKNDWVWQKKAARPDSIVSLAEGYLNQWRVAQNSEIESSWSNFQLGDGAEQWMLPPLNSIKVNVDAALFDEGQRFRVGYVARDSKGLFLEGCTTLHNWADTLKLVEELANMVAHNFVRASILYPGRQFSLEDVPTDLIPYLVAEFVG